MDSVQNLERTIRKSEKQRSEKVRKVGLKVSQEIQILQKRNVDKNLIN